MSTSFISGDQIVNVDEADRITQHYTPSVQEKSLEETPEPPADNSPLEKSDRRRLDRATEQTFQSPFADSGEVHDRAAEFVVPTEWVSPVVKQRQKAANRLPSAASIDDLDQRISAVVRFADPPKQVTNLAQKARLATGAARDAHQAAQHPENPRYTVSVAAKDAVVTEIAKATTAVAALEGAAEDPDIADEWFAGLTEGLDKKRADAVKALRAAEKAYASLRGSINAANALAIGPASYWGSGWHGSVTSEAELNAPIAAMREALSFLDGENADDYTTGRFLSEQYDGIPPHTMARLKRAADRSDGDSFARQVYARALNPHRNDHDAQEAIEKKALIILTSSNPLTADLFFGKKN